MPFAIACGACRRRLNRACHWAANCGAGFVLLLGGGLIAGGWWASLPGSAAPNSRGLPYQKKAAEQGAGKHEGEGRYSWKNNGFSLELPKGWTAKEEQRKKPDATKKESPTFLLITGPKDDWSPNFTVEVMPFT